jgi:hypothetical protein
MRLRRRTKRLLAAIALAASLMAVTAAVTPGVASAVTCYGDYCSGKDPQATGCSTGAYTVAAADVYNKYDGFRFAPYAGYLELRWSPTCKTNWAVQPETGYTQQYVGGPWQTTWTSQIYSPVKCVYAALDVRHGAPFAIWDEIGRTACI